MVREIINKITTTIVIMGELLKAENIRIVMFKNLISLKKEKLKEINLGLISNSQKI